MLGKARAVGEIGVAFRQMAAIRQQNAAQVLCCSRAENLTAIAAVDEQWQIARMIEMCVRQKNGADLVRIDRQRRPILQAERLVTLEQAAIDQNAVFAIVEKIFGSGDGARTAEKCERQGHWAYSRCSTTCTCAFSACTSASAQRPVPGARSAAVPAATAILSASAGVAR